MDKRLVGQFKIVVRRDEIPSIVNFEVVKYPVTTVFVTTTLDESPIDDKVDRIVDSLLPSIRNAVRELYERACIKI